MIVEAEVGNGAIDGEGEVVVVEEVEGEVGAADVDVEDVSGGVSMPVAAARVMERKKEIMP